MSTVETSHALKQQFQQLQEQQQKKLQRRKQLKDEKAKGDRQASADVKISTAFGIEDDLDLKLSDPPEKNSIYSDQLVDHLNEQIRELKDETGRLYKLLSERDLEVRQLRKKQQQSPSQGSAAGLTNETAATKIVELSKKIRELTAELESEKTKSKQFAKKCLNLENEIHNLAPAGTTGSKRLSTTAGGKTPFVEDASDREILESEVKTLQGQLKQAELKMSESRNQCQSLRQEIKVANKVLAQEVGEGATVQSLMNSNSNWRGRAQQIIGLQKKVNELRSQLDSNPPSKADISLEEEFLGSATSRTTRTHNADDRQKEQLRKMDRERKEMQEKMASELKALEQDHENLKHKMEASKARNKVLTSELKSLKQQQQTLLDKGKHDDELIEALLKQQTKLKDALDNTSQTQKSATQKNEENIKQLAMKTQQENNIIEQLRVIVAEKEDKIKTLEEDIRQVKIQKAQLNGVNQLFDQAPAVSPPSSQPLNNQLSSRPSSSRPSTGGTNRPPTVMSDRQRPPTVMCEVMEYGGNTPQISARLDSARTDSQLSQRENSDVRKPGSRLNSARPQSANRPDKAVLEELALQCQEYKSLYQAATVERDKLSELVQILQKRTDEITQNATEAQTELVSQRRKNTQLEKQLGKAKVEQSTSAKKTKSKPGASVTSLREAAMEESLKPGLSAEELEMNLEIQRDENEALKMALQSTLQSKEEDLRLYSEMIEETKKVFLQGLRQYRGQSAGT